MADYNIRANSVVPNKIGSPVGKDDFDPSRPIVNLQTGPVCQVIWPTQWPLVSDQSDFIVGTDRSWMGVFVIMPGEAAEFRQRLLPDTPALSTPIKGIIRWSGHCSFGLELGLTVK